MKTIATILTLAVLLIVAGCATDTVNVYEAEPVQDEVRLSPDTDFISDVQCVEGEGMVFTITNTNALDWIIDSHVMVLVNSMTVEADCDRDEISPGQSTQCSVVAANVGYTPTLMVYSPGGIDTRTVTC